jgi:hypothetical protein
MWLKWKSTCQAGTRPSKKKSKIHVSSIYKTYVSYNIEHVKIEDRRKTLDKMKGTKETMLKAD